MEQFKSIRENYTCILISPSRFRCLWFALLAKSVFWPISMSGPMNALVLGFIVELCVTGRSKSNDWHIVLQMVLNSYKLKRLTNASMHKKNQNWSVCSRLNRIMHDYVFNSLSFLLSSKRLYANQWFSFIPSKHNMGNSKSNCKYMYVYHLAVIRLI